MAHRLLRYRRDDGYYRVSAFRLSRAFFQFFQLGCKQTPKDYFDSED